MGGGEDFATEKKVRFEIASDFLTVLLRKLRVFV